MTTSADRASVEALSEVMVRLTRASHGMRVQLASRAHDGIEWAAYALLCQLVQDGPCRSSELAEAAGVDPSTVSRQVAQLVEAGLAERRPDPGDGRALRLAATDQGRALYAAKRERRVATFARIVEGWPAGDVQALTELVARFNDSFAAVRPALLAGLTDREEGA